MTTPQENLNLSPNIEIRLSDAEVLHKLHQIFGIRNHQDSPSEIRPGQELLQASWIHLLTQYMINQGNAVRNNSMRSSPLIGLPLITPPFMANILINNLFLNNKNSYNFPHFMNSNTNNITYSQPNLKIWKGLCNQTSSGFAQNPLHVCSLEINKENHNNFTGQICNKKCNEMIQSLNNNTIDKNTHFISKKRSRHNDKQSVHKKAKRFTKITESDDSPDAGHSENKTDDSESNKLSQENKEGNISFDIKEVVLDKEESPHKSSHKLERYQLQGVIVKSFKNSQEFMNYHFPVIYYNPDLPVSNDLTKNAKDTIKKIHFQLPNYEEDLKLQPFSDPAPPKKVWTPSSVNRIYQFNPKS